MTRVRSGGLPDTKERVCCGAVRRAGYCAARRIQQPLQAVGGRAARRGRWRWCRRRTLRQSGLTHDGEHDTILNFRGREGVLLPCGSRDRLRWSLSSRLKGCHCVGSPAPSASPAVDPALFRETARKRKHVGSQPVLCLYSEVASSGALSVAIAAWVRPRSIGQRDSRGPVAGVVGN